MATACKWSDDIYKNVEIRLILKTPRSFFSIPKCPTVAAAATTIKKTNKTIQDFFRDYHCECCVYRSVDISGMTMGKYVNSSFIVIFYPRGRQESLLLLLNDIGPCAWCARFFPAVSSFSACLASVSHKTLNRPVPPSSHLSFLLLFVLKR